MKALKHLALIGVIVMLSACSSVTVDHYQDTNPPVALEEFFSGPIKGWGVVQDPKGRVLQRFDVVMEGRWEGDTGILDEQFVYYDGRRQHRIWTITRHADGTYSGAADDIIGKASGRAAGSAIQWKYVMDLPVGGRTYRVTFDDWMFRMNDGVIVNRSYIRKFGITFAELSLFMQKQ